MAKVVNMDVSSAWQDVISNVIDNNRSRLQEISHEIWSHPELPFQERHAVAVVSKFLEQEDFKVEQGFVTPTDFKATFGSNADGDAGVHVCFLCEYDSVPGVGHAAGHNLTSEASIAAAVALKECIKKAQLSGRITVLGTPAEDSGAGAKIDMINKGCFKDIDIAVMLNPYTENLVFPQYYALVIVDVTYKGKAAHASAAAWEGRNALDAAVACYSNIALLRQQMKPTWQINGIISKGGVQPNVIPDESCLSFWLRAPAQRDLVLVQQKVQACIVAAAKATGCEAEIEFRDKQYEPLHHNSLLGKMYRKNAVKLGVDFQHEHENLSTHIGSSDMGNVSHVVPSLSPAFGISTTAVKNSLGFVQAAGQPEAQECTLKAAKAIAITAGEVMEKPDLLVQIKNEYVVNNTPSGLRIFRKDDSPLYDAEQFP